MKFTILYNEYGPKPTIEPGDIFRVADWGNVDVDDDFPPAPSESDVPIRTLERIRVLHDRQERPLRQGDVILMFGVFYLYDAYPPSGGFTPLRRPESIAAVEATFTR